MIIIYESNLYDKNNNLLDRQFYSREEKHWVYWITFKLNEWSKFRNQGIRKELKKIQFINGQEIVEKIDDKILGININNPQY